jgi:NAD(P)-dependent dehydrogenase (short-subunit alcohol dehydrogenase family)
MQVEGAVALVTGGNRGIGEAFVRRLLAAGAAHVYAAARDPDAAQHLVEEGGGRVSAVRLDVTDPAQVAAATEACGDVSILVNNAGAFLNQRLIAAPDIEAARAEMETNYFGPLLMSRAFAPVLGAHDRSVIVNVLSAGAIVPVPGMGGYSPSKFAARAMSGCVRAELHDQGTRVTVLIVGSVDTRMSAHVEGWKETPDTIAAAGIRAIRRDIDEVDTDVMAVEVRAHLARDPRGIEEMMRLALGHDTVRTGR